MIIFIVALSAIAFFASLIYVDHQRERIVLALLSGAVLLLSLAAVTANFHDHFGMKKVTTVSSKRIYSVGRSNAFQMILYQPLGSSGSEQVYLYKNSSSSKKIKHTQASEFTQNKVVAVDSDKARIQKKEVRWQYRSELSRVLFAWSGINGQLVSRKNTFYIPKRWFRLTTSQASLLQKKLDPKQLQQQGRIFVENRLKEAVGKDPSLISNKQAQASLTKKYSAEFQRQAVNNLLKKNK
ncbi:DUF4811 domain-containing protein [Oenococcus alcoholitolerans]|uniref:DUF4811 domain-containing protein n=1 Tax=Oenococcus alcoholitolerans TaxID=931074 RepID=UPI003F6F2BD2